MQLGGAATEQFTEQLLEVAIDRGERRQEPFARFTVEAVDALPQAADRFDEIVALGGQLAVLGFDVGKLLLRQEVDRAEAFALAPDALELALDLADLRQWLISLELGDLCCCRRLDVEEVADFVFEIAEASLGAVAAVFCTRGLGAGVADRVERDACRLVGLGEVGFRLRQQVGGGPPRGGRRFNLADQRLTLTGEFLRRMFELDPSIDANKISAKIDQGLVTLTLPKAEHVKPRKITVS